MLDIFVRTTWCESKFCKVR